MAKSPLGLFKTKSTRARKTAKHNANVENRARLHHEKAKETNPDKRNTIQQAIDAISNQV